VDPEDQGDRMGSVHHLEDLGVLEIQRIF
jgi:hypothetical protein